MSIQMKTTPNPMDRWKSKSLNSLPVQRYELTPTLGSVRILKLNQRSLCVTDSHQIRCLWVATSDDRTKMNLKRTFNQASFSFTPEIKFIVGIPNNNFVVALDNALVLMTIAHDLTIKHQIHCQLPLCGVTNKGSLLIMARDHVYQCNAVIYADGVDESMIAKSKRRVKYGTRAQESIISEMKAIALMVSNELTAQVYCFGCTKTDKGELLHLVILTLSSQQEYSANLYTIDQVFEHNLFLHSKVFQLEHKVFLFSLKEQIIVIKENFNRYIIWDNVSVVTTRSVTKKGQLVLANQQIVVYSEGAQIYAHEILFTEGKLEMPPIDSFKGNDDENDLLLDAYMLEYEEDSLMKVLLYANPMTPSTIVVVCINQSDPKEKLTQLLGKGKLPAEIGDFCARFSISELELKKCQWSVCEKKLKDIENVLLSITDSEFIQEQLNSILKQQPHNLDFLIAVENSQIRRLKKLLITSLINKEEVSKAVQWLMESIMFEKKLQYSINFLTFKEYDFIEISKLRAASLKEQIKLLSCKKYEKRLKYFLNSFKVLAIANFSEVFSFLLADKSEQEVQQFIIDFQFILPSFKEQSAVLMSSHASLRESNKKKIVRFTSQKDELLTEKDLSDEKCILWEELDDKPITQTMEHFQSSIIEGIQGEVPDLQKEDTILRFKQALKSIQKGVWFKNAAFKQHAMITKTDTQLRQLFHYLKNEGVFNTLIHLLYKNYIDNKFKLQLVDEMLEKFAMIKKIIPLTLKRNLDARKSIYDTILIKIPQTQVDIPYLPDYLIWSQPHYIQYLLTVTRKSLFQDIKRIYDHIQSGFFKQRLQLYLSSTLVTPKLLLELMSDCEEVIKGHRASGEEKHTAIIEGLEEIIGDIYESVKINMRLSDRVHAEEYVQKHKEELIKIGFMFYGVFKMGKCKGTYAELEEAIMMERNNALIENIVKEYVEEGYLVRDSSSNKSNSHSNNKSVSGIINHNTNNSAILQKSVSISNSSKHSSEEYEHTIQKQKQSIVKIYEEEKETTYMIEFQPYKGVKPPSINIHNQPVQFLNIMLKLFSMLHFKMKQQTLFQIFIQNYLRQRKFSQLEQLIATIQNAVPPNPITAFKRKNDFLNIFIGYMIRWVNNQYESLHIHPQTTLQDSHQALSLTLNLSGAIPQLRKESSFLNLLSLLHEYQAPFKVSELRHNLTTQSPFHFMINLLNNTPHLTTHSIDLVEKIYTAFETTANRHDNEYKHIMVQLTLMLIRRNDIPLLRHMLLHKINDSGYYTTDVLLMVASRTKHPYSESRLIQLITTTDKKKEIQALLLEQFKEEEEYTTTFQSVYNRYRYDDAFFFAVRARIPLKNMKCRGEKTNILMAYMLLVCYVKCLEQCGSTHNGFYPTFQFFTGKWIQLIDAKDNINILKDIYMLIIKMEKIGMQGDQLKTMYEEYILSIGQNMDLVERETKNIPKTGEREGKAEREAPILSLQRNEYEIEKIQQINVSEMTKRSNEAQTQINKVKKRRDSMVVMPQQPQIHIQSSKMEDVLSEIKEKVSMIKHTESEAINKIQKGEATKRVQELLNALRESKERLVQEYSPNREIKDYVPPLKIQPSQSTFSNKLKQFRPKAPLVQPISMKKIKSIEQVVSLYKETECPDACLLLLKHDLMRHPQTRAQFIKRLYHQTKQLYNWVTCCQSLLTLQESWSRVIEPRVLPILNQLLKMNEKSRIDLKQLIPAEVVMWGGGGEVQAHIYEVMRPKIRKAFEKEAMAVHTVSILIKYTLGEKYSSEVSYEYVCALARLYSKTDEHKDMYLLAEKIKGVIVAMHDEGKVEQILVQSGKNRDTLKSSLIKSLGKKPQHSKIIEVIERH